MKEFMIEEHIQSNLKNVGHSSTSLKRTPLGDKVIIKASRPGFIVGRKGEKIKALTESIRKGFGLDKPQIEIEEVENVNLDANIVAERIASTLERFGAGRFKGIGHKVMEDVMNSGALGIEILITGKIPGTRAKRWRFYQGYLKKCGDVAVAGVLKSKTVAKLKTGIIGIQVSIMPPDLVLPDNISVHLPSDEQVGQVEDVKEEISEAEETEATEEKKE